MIPKLVKFPEDLLEGIYAAAKREGVTFSAYIRQAVTEKLAGKAAEPLDSWDPPPPKGVEVPMSLEEARRTDFDDAPVRCRCGGRKHPVKDRCLSCNQRLTA